MDPKLVALAGVTVFAALEFICILTLAKKLKKAK